MDQATRRKVLIGIGALAGVGVLGVGASALLLPRVPLTGTYFSVDGVAVRGTDVVAYFTESAPVPGSSDHAYDWSGVTWHFASAENRDAFAANPEAYAPQYGGYCAWAVAAKSELYSTQPRNWSVVDGKLYLNFNDGVQDTWNGDIPGFISTGDQNWPGLRDQLAESG